MKIGKRIWFSVTLLPMVAIYAILYVFPSIWMGEYDSEHWLGMK